MPNKKEHSEAGALVGMVFACCANVLEQAERARMNPYYRFNVFELAVVGVLGNVVGRFAGQLPDLLEPAYHPGHRDFFHSVGFSALAAVGVKKLYTNPRVSPVVKLVAKTAVAGYASHVLMDGGTPAGVPMITRRRALSNC